MKNLILFFCVLYLSINAQAQTIERISVNGRIIVDVNDVEGVTVYNTSSNKGTITNKQGEFKIDVALNDIIELSALQFEKFTVKIDQEILNNKYFTVYLVEQINKLDEVIIMPYDMLSGNIIVDVESVKTFNPDLNAIYFGVNDIYAYEFTDDYKSEVVNTAMTQEHFKYGVDVIGVLGMVLKPIFKSKNNKENVSEANFPSVYKDSKDITDVYGRAFIINSFNIPESRVEAFVGFVNSNNFDQQLLTKDNEVRLLEFLFSKSQQFLKMEIEKD